MLNKIKFSCKVADKQKGLVTPEHTLFKCKIKIDGLQYSFDYQCNIKYYNNPNLIDCMDSMLDNINCYEDAIDEVDFCSKFGYDDLNVGIKKYKAYKKTYKALHRLFTDEELEEIGEEISAYY